MPAPAALLAGLGLAALLLFSGSKQAGAATPSSKPLDPNMPPDVDAKFKQALATIKDPAILDQLANSAELAGFPNTAAAFRSRAAQIRGQIVIPGVPVPPAPPPPTPTLPPGGGVVPPWIPGVPGIPGFPLPPPIIPGVPPAAPPPPTPTPIENLDPNLPPAIATSVATLLAKADWSEQELATADALANTLEKSGFPIAAGKLRAKAISIRALHAGAVLLDQITKILTTPPGQLPPGLPTSLPGTPPIITIPPASPPGVPPPSAPLAKTYKVASGDNPSKIAQMFTGNAANFRQLAAANPDKSARILAGTIYVGEILTLPDAWPAKPQFSAPTAPPPSAPTPAPAPSALAGPHATIQRGSSGADVVLWQKIVGVTADGQFGPNTESATRTWQSQHGLTADGIVGPMTWTAAQVAAGIAVATTVPGTTIPIPPMPTGPTIPIGFPPAAPPIGTRATIQQGSSGPDVVLWQTLIGVTPDGKFGPATAAATKTWQSQHGITPDGVVGPMTWAAAQRTVPVVTVSTPAAVPTTRPPLAVAPPAAPVVPTARPPLATAPVPMPAAPAPPSPSPAASRATLKQGSSGPDVVLWQKVIGVATDGKFGPGTAAATKTWQAKHGLPADGVVGPKTWAAALGPGSAVAGAGPTYEVQPNDTPFTIARRFTGDGTRMFELAEANPETAPNIRNGIVFQGQALNLPGDWHVGYEAVGDESALAGVLDIIGASHGRPTHGDYWGG